MKNETKVWFDTEFIHIKTKNEKTAKMPLNWFPKLEKATISELEDYELWSEGEWIHWENLNEDLSVEGFFSYNPSVKRELELVD